ncbi:MAG: helix-turn-helix transcriptional regulator [Clostridiales bacterium]|jgi:transcriptional regulator with XRE-family HTH domain|nr:helix-turn-helix transcriptional regulator [Clostridiales bacterium]
MFQDRFGILLQCKGLSPYKIAKDTKIPKSIIYEWASREREPVSEYLIPLADYLGCSVDYLLGRTDTPEVNRSPEHQK